MPIKFDQYRWLTPTESKSHSDMCALDDTFQLPHQYYQTGDLIVGMISSQFGCIFHEAFFHKHPEANFVYELLPTLKYYQNVLSLVFAVKEINENPKVLNSSLGFSIYESYTNERMTHQNTLKLLTTTDWIVPNFKCGKKESVVAVIGGLDSEISLHMASILGMYKIPQVAYCILSPLMSAEVQLRFFYRTVPNEFYQYEGILYLLLHFQWSWVGIIASDNENGVQFLHVFIPMLSRKGICTAFTEKMPAISHATEMLSMALELLRAKVLKLNDSKVKVLVINAEPQTMTCFTWMMYFCSIIEDIPMASLGKVWVLTAQWDFSRQTMQKHFDIQDFHGALSFQIHVKDVLGFQEFLHLLNPHSPTGDGFLRGFWEEAFDCTFSGSNVRNGIVETCTGKEELQSLPNTLFELSMTGQSYSIYNAVHAIAHALQKMHSARTKHRGMPNREKWDLPDLQPWQHYFSRSEIAAAISAHHFCLLLLLSIQLHPFLRSISFNNSAGDLVSFHENGELAAGFDLINWVTFPNQSFLRVQVGGMDPQAISGQEFTINKEAITWHRAFHQVLPIARCNNNCPSGSRTKKKEGHPFCCYARIPCPAEMFSDQTDMDNCFYCPEEQFPNREQDHCIPKSLNFLSFSEPLGMTFTFLALSFDLITALVLAAFIKNRNTPIIKANNRDLTYSLLTSLLLCFLCPLLFIGQPKAVTCSLRQTAFAVIFAVAISCVLAKTITVVLAFLATKPGSRMRKWVGKTLANSILLGCSSIQATLCVFWLRTTPPFPAKDLKSLPKEIILECNEGSVIMLYCVLGYLGFLASVSFMVAFLARSLPNTFNEAKFITFSMLVFAVSGCHSFHHT
ncbi:Vomeronasal type-2 receptor 26 [Varanus komodoensis]|nr:Vomeronasal type-2 receptor 26 [Varanus komodoensis]